MAMQFTPFNPNPYAVFDPSQWSNPFSAFNNAPIPPTQVQDAYQGGPGWPTDALGRPIAMPPGMTLNTPPPPAAPAAPAAAAPTNPPAIYQLASNAAMQRVLQNQAQGMSGVQGGTTGSGNQAPTTYGDPVGLAISLNQPTAANAAAYGPQYGAAINRMAASGITPEIAAARAAAFTAPGATLQSVMNTPGLGAVPPGSTQAAAAPAPSSANSTGNPALTYTQYLQLLSNPGKVVTPGGDPNAAPAVQPGSGVLQQFLQNWQPAQSGPGSQFQQIFANALAQPQAAPAAAPAEPPSKKRGR
jgi:hypothetical protein